MLILLVYKYTQEYHIRHTAALPQGCRSEHPYTTIKAVLHSWPGPVVSALDAERHCERRVGRLSTALVACSICRMRSLSQIHSVSTTVKAISKEDPRILATGPGGSWKTW